MHFSIGKKIAITFAVVFALSIVSGLVVYAKLKDLRKRQQAVASSRIPAMQVIYDLRIADQRLISDLYSYLFLTQDAGSTDKIRQQIVQQQQRVEGDLVKLREISSSLRIEENKQRIARIDAEFADLSKTADVIKEQGRGSSTSRKRAIALLRSQATPKADAIRDLGKDLIAGLNDITAADAAAIDSESQSIAWILASSTGLVVLFGSVLTWRITRGIVVPLHGVVVRAKEIAAHQLGGNALVSSSHDEVGELTSAVNTMHASLRQVIESISQGAEHLASASEEISSGATQSADIAHTQADQTHQVATAMQEMSCTVQQVSENSQKAADSSHSAAQAARQGGQVVEETLATMRTIAESTRKVATRITELGKHSEKIGKIVAVIDDIADQTNLLALNAAIEAARAGEQGRGFAVVADEVRKLAERTTKATKEIAAMIESIQAETKSAVAAMELGSREVQVGVDKTAASGTALEEIIKMSEQVGDMISQIATAAAEQSSATEQINANVSQISSSTQESSAAAGQTAKACADLSDLALDLQRLVTQFKLEAASRAASRPQTQTGQPKAKSKAAAAGRA
jgi:methyl-accepting chemotaxis protein